MEVTRFMISRSLRGEVQDPHDEQFEVIQA
jgi:hypothetical protein